MIFALVVCVAAWSLPAAAGDVKYIYDDAGRLVGVVDATGNAAQYVYDPAGNITQVNRIAAGTLAIIDFSPKSGPVGTQVTIWGSGFDPTPSNNIVSFNGSGASVASSTPNQLVVTVPATATTGVISVSVSGAAANSPKPFVVTATNAAGCASNVSGFTPSIGVVGTGITITGAGFSTSDVVQLNGTAAPVQSVTTTALATMVPAAATSGHLSLAMPPLCAAFNLGDFFVPPSGYTVSDIAVTGRLTLNGASTSFNLASGKKALFVFDATGMSVAGIYVSGSTFSSVTVDIRAPNGSVVATRTITAAQADVAQVELPGTGGYSIFVNPGTASGAMTLQVGAPDLTIGNASIGTVIFNQRGSYGIPLAFTVANSGGIQADPDWSDYLYLSTNGALDTESISIGSSAHTTALAAGQSYAVNKTYISAVGLAPGAYTAFIKADGLPPPRSNGGVFEGNENNNVVGPFTVVLPPPPDLSVSNGSVGTVTENNNGSFNIPVSFTVNNLSGTAAQPSWYDSGYLSQNGALDSASTYIGTTQRTIALAGNGSYNISQTFRTNGTTLPPGTYTLFLKADGDTTPTSNGSLVEASESNNAASIGVVLPTYPDLAIANPALGTVVENQNGSYSIPMSFSVNNLGVTAAQSPWLDYAFLSSNGVLDASSIVLGGTQHSTSLSGGAGYTVTQTYRTSASFTPGTYTVFLKANSGSAPTANGSLVESGYANNATSGLTVVFPTYPDLAISNPSVGSVIANQSGSFSIPVSFTVTNLGTTPAQSTWSDYVYLSRNGALDSASTWIGLTQRTTALAGGAQYTVTQNFTASGFSPGTYALFVKADGTATSGNGGLVETDESNNATAAINVTLPPYPDLAVSSASVGTITKSPSGSYNVPVTFTVTNLGTTAAQASWSDYAYLSRNTLLDSSSTSVGLVQHSTVLAGGSSYTVNATFLVSGFSAGTYTLFLKADGNTATGNGYVKESDETNNASAGISVTFN